MFEFQRLAQRGAWMAMGKREAERRQDLFVTHDKLPGIENVRKRYLISAAAHNLGCLMRALFNMGTPRGLQQFKRGLAGILADSFLSVQLAWK